MMDHKEIEHNARFLATSSDPKAIKCAEGMIERLCIIANKRTDEWTRANNDSAYHKSSTHRAWWAHIEKQRQHLELELEFFFCATVDWPGLYPVVTCKDGKQIYIY